MTDRARDVLAASNGMRLAIVVPVYDDWESFLALVPMLDRALVGIVSKVTILAVDDGSTNVIDGAAIARLGPLGVIESVELLHLITNVGHQRAIAIGLAAAVSSGGYSHVLVMDSDGEDRPEEAVRLVDCNLHDDAGRAGLVYVAQRHRRSEGIAFRLYYAMYKLLFRFLSGQTIDFGNFSLLPISAVRKLIHTPETWNHFAASLVKARIPLRRIPTSRGTRIAGRSSMNLVMLVTLGLSAISVYSEAVFVRMLLTSIVLSMAAALGLAGVVAIRIFTNFAIPGWATTAGGILGIILVQALTLSMIASFLALSARSGVLTVPASDAERFIERRKVIAVGAPEVHVG